VRNEVVGAVVFADREHGQAELICEARFLEEASHALPRREPWRQISEGDEVEFHDGNAAQPRHDLDYACAMGRPRRFPSFQRVERVVCRGSLLPGQMRRARRYR
jgi:hypothetical protein